VALKRSSRAQLPLAGLRILVGRARHQASALGSGLAELGAEIISIPFLEIRRPRSYQALDAAVRDLARYDWLILTSVNGVEALWRRIVHLGLERQAWPDLRVAAIGPATAKALVRHGFPVDVVPEQYVAESVVQSLGDQVSGKRILLARARVARDILPRELARLGARVDVVEAYQTVIPASSRTKIRQALSSPHGRPHLVAFTSSSSVQNFLALVGGGGAPKSRETLRGIRFASIGPITSQTLREAGLAVDIEAKQYTIPGLIAELGLWATSRRRGN
jgi:uroporphyrinogen-III synthase